MFGFVGMGLQRIGSCSVTSGGGGGGEYTAQSVHFDGSTVLGLTNRSAPIAAASPTGLFACWLKVNMVEVINSYLLVYDSGEEGGALGYFDILLGALSVPNGFGSDFADFPEFSIGYSANANSSPFPSAWTPLLVAWDMGHAPESRVYQVYFGDTPITPTTEQNDGATGFDIAYQSNGWTFFGAYFEGEGGGPGSVFEGDAADLQMWCGITADLSNQSVRRLFIDAGGKPVNPTVAAGELGAPTICFSGDASSFATNQGSGAATSIIVGSLTNATTSPSD